MASLELSCITGISFLDNQSVVCSFVLGCIASGCKVVIECDPKLTTVKQDLYILDLTKKNDSLVSEDGLLPCESIAMCTANSVFVYAVYNNSPSDVPDVVHSSTSIHVCSSSTSELIITCTSAHFTLLLKQ